MQEIVYHTNYKLENNYWWFVARNNIIANAIESKTLLNSGDQILDFGCGTGGFASIINRKFDVIGLDMSDLALDYARKSGIEKLYNTDIRDFKFHDFDIKAVTALDVIEHIENDFEIVKHIYDNLQRGAYFIASVPAYKFLWSYHDEMHMHYRRYTKRNFTDLLRKAGFEINFASYFNTFLFPLALAKRITEKKSIDPNDKSEKYTPVNEVPKFVDTLFRNIFLSEKAFLNFMSFPFGLSILVVSQKV